MYIYIYKCYSIYPHENPRNRSPVHRNTRVDIQLPWPSPEPQPEPLLCDFQKWKTTNRTTVCFSWLTLYVYMIYIYMIYDIYINILTRCICIYLRCIPILAQMCPILGAKHNTSFWLNPESFSSRCQNGRRLAIIYIIYIIYNIISYHIT